MSGTFAYALCHNDAKNMTTPLALPPCYLRHFQIFDKINNFPKKKKNVFRIKKGKLHLLRTA